LEDEIYTQGKIYPRLSTTVLDSVLYSAVIGTGELVFLLPAFVWWFKLLDTQLKS